MLNRPVAPQPVKKIRPPLFNEPQDGFLDFPGPARFHEFAVFADDVVVHVKKQFQRGGDIPLRHLAQIGRDGMGSFRDQRAEFELAADFQKFFRTFLGTGAHTFELMTLSTRCHADSFGPGHL